MINLVFRIVVEVLFGISRLTGFTYNEVNILLYYFFIPFTWLLLLDKIFHFHYFKIAFVIFCLGFYIWCKDFKGFSDWLFDRSVDFLKYFDRFGSNYSASSVWICVVLPLFIYALLIFILIKK